MNSTKIFRSQLNNKFPSHSLRIHNFTWNLVPTRPKYLIPWVSIWLLWNSYIVPCMRFLHQIILRGSVDVTRLTSIKITCPVYLTAKPQIERWSLKPLDNNGVVLSLKTAVIECLVFPRVTSGKEGLTYRETPTLYIPLTSIASIAHWLWHPRKTVQC